MSVIAPCLDGAPSYPIPVPAPDSLFGLVRAEAMLAMADLLGGVLHDLNSPLCAVVGQAHALQQRLQEGPDAEAAARIVRAAERMAGVARRFVLLAREGSSEEGLVSLNGIVEETTPLFAYPMAVRRVRLETELREPTPMLIARSREAQMLVVSLLAPAMEVAALGPTALRIETFRPSPAHAVLQVSVPGRAIWVGPRPCVFSSGDRPRQSSFLAANLAEQLGGELRVEEGLLRVDLPAYLSA